MDVVSKFIKFAGVGGIATLLQYGLLILFIELFAVAKLLASVLSYALSAVCNYWLNYHFTFNSSQDHLSTLPKFVGIVLVGLLFNTAVFYACSSALGFHYLFAQAAATVITLIWNFSINNLWTFSTKSRAN